MLVPLLVVVLAAADTACTESGRDYADGAHVLQVVRNRAALRWRGARSLLEALNDRHQHAHGCRWPLAWGHFELAARFVADALPVEPWARRALYYCGDADAPGTCERYGRVEVVGVVRHRFYGRSR